MAAVLAEAGAQAGHTVSCLLFATKLLLWRSATMAVQRCNDPATMALQPSPTRLCGGRDGKISGHKLARRSSRWMERVQPWLRRRSACVA